METGSKNDNQSLGTLEDDGLQSPLLQNPPPPSAAAKPPKTPAKKAIRKAFKGTAHLSNLLPTGSVLTFQVLSPVFTHEGKCKSFASKTTTMALLSFCTFTCFVLSFTDSFRDGRGKVRYGLATFRGLWVIDGSGSAVAPPPHEAEKFRIRFVDFLHALMSVLVFGAVAMFDKNVVRCFYPTPSEEAEEILKTVPMTVGLICSVLFLVFPTRRHGIGFPLSRT